MQNSSNVSKIEQDFELICNLFKNRKTSNYSIASLVKVLKSFGFDKTNQRFKCMFDKLEILEVKQDYLKIVEADKTTFRELIHPCIPLISQAIRNQLIIPAWIEFTRIIEDIFYECWHIEEEGSDLDLAQVWAISICSIDGQRFSLGNCEEKFCLRSISKSFNYAILASEIGSDLLHKYVGHEPSGRDANDISLDSNNKPFNPIIDSGAIVVVSMIKPGDTTADRYEFMLDSFKNIAGHEHIGFDNVSYLERKKKADRIRSSSFYLRENRCFPETSQVYEDEKMLEREVDLLLQLGALETNCETASVMAATLANGGVCPLTMTSCIEPQPCRDILSLLGSCGLYEYSGNFSFQIGLPAKSDPSGLMILIIPNVMGIAFYSPSSRRPTTSRRSIAFCQKLVEIFNFHQYDSVLQNLDKIDPRRTTPHEEVDIVEETMRAAKNGNLRLLRAAYMEEFDLRTPDSQMRTALHYSASEGRTEVCKFLIEVGRCEVNSRDSNGKCPLDDAVQFKHRGTASYLFKLQFPTKEMPDNIFEEGVIFSTLDFGKEEMKNEDVSEEETSETSADIPKVYANGIIVFHFFMNLIQLLFKMILYMFSKIF